MKTLTPKKFLIKEEECIKLLGNHCWRMANTVIPNSIPTKFGRICRHCGKTEYKTMEEMNRED
jgi:hypothetical protein